MPRPVTLMPWTAHWAVRAEALIADLHAAAPGVFVAVHHVGSTAVPGLTAKPVIDLLGETGDLARIEAAAGVRDRFALPRAAGSPGLRREGAACRRMTKGRGGG